MGKVRIVDVSDEGDGKYSMPIPAEMTEEDALSIHADVEMMIGVIESPPDPREDWPQ